MEKRKKSEMRAQLKEIIKVPREDRLANWCSEVSLAMLNCPDRLKGVIFKCTDNVGCAAHKYFRTILYKNGVMNTEEASLMNKMYRFGASSTCFRYLRQFFYTGCIAELEDAKSLEPFMADIDELLTLSLQPRKDHLGGVDKYLARKLCEKRPENIKVAMSRLCLGLNHSVQEVVDGMRIVIPTLEFTTDCFSEVKHISTDVLELVLRDIPLPATELDVCRAVHNWAQAYFGVDLDEPASDELPDSDPASDDLLIMPTREDRRVLQYIDLSCIKASDIRTTVIPMRLFDRQAIVQAQRKHAIQRTGNLDSRVNRQRGRFEERAGSTIVGPPDMNKLSLK